MTEKELQAHVTQLRTLCAELSHGNGDSAIVRALEPGLAALYREMGVDEKGMLVPETWSKASDQQRLELVARLEGALKVLKTSMADMDEPKEASNFMYRVHASNGAVYALVACSVLVIAAVLVAVWYFWPEVSAPLPQESKVLLMIMLMGALGGTVHWMSSLVNFIGNGNLMRRWIPYYLLAPFQGAALAVLVYLTLRVGVLNAGASNTTENLNLVGLFAFAGLTGLFAKQAIEMLRDVFSAMFKRIDAKDPSARRGPSGADRR